MLGGDQLKLRPCCGPVTAGVFSPSYMRFLSFLPKSYLSWFVGHAARLPLPRPLARFSISLFAQAYSIDSTLATRPLESFRSIGDFFTRDLKPECRPIGEGAVSPVDGTLRSCQELTASGEATQVKGKTFSVSELLAGDEVVGRFEHGQLWNFYLSPQDAHHIHSPVDGRIVRTIHIPGKLWPVNDWALNSIDRLFAVNERVVSIIESNLGTVAVVMVGATNVGRIKLTYSDFVTNRFPWAHKVTTTIEHEAPIVVHRGQKLGTFMMGSSVLLVSERQLAASPDTTTPIRAQYGVPLAKLAR